MNERNCKAPDRIETHRLMLRPPRPADAGAIFERYSSDAEVTKYLSWPRHRSIEDTRAFIGFSKAEWLKWPAGPYLVFSRAGSALLGGAGLHFETAERAETGYVLARDAWGHGYATEALWAMVKLAPQVGVRRLYALCHPEHRPSQRVLEKGGFDCEGLVHERAQLPNLAPGCKIDMLCYSRIFRTSPSEEARLDVD